MFTLVRSKRFRKMFRRIVGSGRFNIAVFEEVMNCLVKGNPLNQKFRDHSLIGNHAGLRECHLTPDLLLVYEVDIHLKIVTLAKIGSHSEIFG